MTPMQLSVVLVLFLLPVLGVLINCLAMLERIEKHPRELHVRALRQLAERTPEDMRIRRLELGLEDGYLTGWGTDSETLPLEWRNVDFTAGEVRLDPGTTKNKDGRVFPMTNELRVLLT